MRGIVAHTFLPSFSILAFLTLGAGAAFADEAASATITVDSLAGPTYHYTVTLTNTGDTDIGTFWYGWVDSPDYDFLPSHPTVTGSPAGWINITPGAGPPYDGYSIEWYNLTGSAIAPGDSATFKFSSPDSPGALTQNENTYYNLFYPALPVQTSFIYAGFPQTDAGASFVLPAPTLANAPEPASLGILAAGAAALLLRKRRKL